MKPVCLLASAVPVALVRACRESAVPMDCLDAFRESLQPVGLNLLGVASVASYDTQVKPARSARALFPDTRSILVVGNGGPALWSAFVSDLERTPRHLTHEPHPLEAFVEREVRRADALLGDVPRRWFFAAVEAPVALDFRLLGHLAGLGGDSRLRLLMHPEHGLWIALRAACFLALPLPSSVPGGPDRCSGCSAPCAAACPGAAFAGGTWDVDRCSAFHAESDVCRTTCHARMACPHGATSRYPPEALRYHTHPVLGRAWLRARLGVPDSEDLFPGATPLWQDWRARVDVSGASSPTPAHPRWRQSHP